MHYSNHIHNHFNLLFSLKYYIDRTSLYYNPAFKCKGEGLYVPSPFIPLNEVKI